MKKGLSEIVVLRPTAAFLAFLASQLPESHVPSFSCLQKDSTAYVIKRRATDEETIDEIARYFSQMFRHEICRWLGRDARNKIEDSFFDFLCCFKMEFHKHLILMEPTLDAARQMILINPRLALLTWMKEVVKEEEDLSEILEKVSLSHLLENASALLKNFSALKDIKPFLQQQYWFVFVKSMKRFSSHYQDWPKIDSLSAFIQYFSIEIHTQLIHLHA